MGLHSIAWHFGEASVDELEKTWPVERVQGWLSYGKAIGGLAPLTAGQFCYGIWVLARSFGCEIKLEDLYLPEVGREQTAEEAEAALGQWDAHTKRVKQKILPGERIK